MIYIYHIKRKSAITIATTKLSVTKSTSWVINYAEKRSVEKSEIMPSQVLKRLVNYMANGGNQERRKRLIMLNIKDQNYFKRALKIFILSTALLLVTIPIALIFHPSEEFIKQLGSSSPENVSKTQGLKFEVLYKIMAFMYQYKCFC